MGSGSGSGSDAWKNCMKVVDALINASCSQEDIDLQYDLCSSIVTEGDYGKPMLWIGIYIAVASVFCVLAMAADLFHGFRNKKLWFPSKYFTLNVASITVITIAMKLPVDLNAPMPGWTDQFGKMVSIPFMSTMMANLIPSLASMDDNQLFANVIGLLILVITIVVNVSIEIRTSVIDGYLRMATLIYIGATVYLLLILTSLALLIPTAKHLLESKYQAAHIRESKDIHPQRRRHTRIPRVDELIKCVRRYSIMAGSCSPQFVMATTPLCSAAGIICVSSTIVYFYYVARFVSHNLDKHLVYDYASSYKWTVLVIFITQSVGVVVGTIAPIFRCFSVSSFKLSLKWCKKYTNIFQVEQYWIKILLEWKEIYLVFPLRGRILKSLARNLNNLILNVFIGFQKAIVVSCKTITLIPIGIITLGVCCIDSWKSLKAMFITMPNVSNRDIIHTLEQIDTDDEDLGTYVLQLQDETELGTRTLKNISNSVNRLIQKAEKQLPRNLLKLVEQSSGFDGVVKFDSDKVQPITSVKLPNSWSLPVVTLTCIAITLPNICKDTVDGLFNSVCEAIPYTFLVEESLNNVGEARNIKRATMTLWNEVEVTYKWLGNPLQRNDLKEKTPTEILKWFSNKAEEIVVEINKNNNKEMLENSQNKLIAANSMYRITQTIMLDFHGNEHIREEQLYAMLSDMIANIVVSCLTNLPRVITMKCYECAIEKRETSVQAAAKLLGSAMKIIERLHECELPCLDPYQMAFIEEWRDYLKQSTA